MSERSEDVVAPQQARDLLASVPKRRRREMSARDHLCAVATILLSLAAGLVALAGQPWWALVPALGALLVAHTWLDGRRSRPNEPRLGAHTIAVALFTVWLLLPIWRGVTRGDEAPFPESLVLAGLAPVVWLGFYLVLLIRR
ncbi:hypothetical protein [Pseudactinotalea suaedae]|uniref:hypothetical protein n=1 Tax=Pseudactinotalea suaedae TaxID=1524924 RepID=UPI0012E3132B|nr:hypothetical protein [Pseudactinotalea suaedae]